MANSLRNLTETLTLDSRFGHLYRPLVRNLILIVVLTIVSAAAVLVYFDGRLVNSLSAQLIENSTMSATRKLERRFEGAGRALRVAQAQAQLLQIGSVEKRDALFVALEPYLKEVRFLDSINLADSSGSEFAVIPQADGTLTRQVLGSDPKNAMWRRRVDGKVVEEWTRQIDVSPLSRPWYQGALARRPRTHFWTAPYSFLTSKEPGISVSTRAPSVDGEGEFVVAFNLTLMNISEFTTGVRPSENGMTVVFTDEGETIGLPPDPRFETQDGLLSRVLTPVELLGVAELDAALAEWNTRGRVDGNFPFQLGAATWWAGLSPIELDEDYTVWSMVIVPEDDFLGAAPQQRNIWLAVIGLAALAIAGALFVTSMRSIRQQMKAAVDQAGQRFGQYHLKQKIGQGGNGAVYRAQHCLLRRPTAIKLMNPDFVRTPACRDRFEHEVQITSSLSHPNTIAIYDYGQTPEGTLYYAMELLNGGTLEELVACSGPMPAGRVVHVLEQMAGSLSEAHAKGLIHRDIKPSNAILCERGGLFDVVKVLDFGLVKQVESTDAHLTQANVLVGTPLYMAPELIQGADSGSPQSDIYAVGAAGYFLLTGQNVFEGASSVEICAKHLNEMPVPPSQRVGFPIPEDIEAVILACLEKDPARRPADAATLRASLLDCADSGRWLQQDAHEWWQTYQAAFIGGSSPEESTPLANTELLVDLDERLGSAGGARSA